MVSKPDQQVYRWLRRMGIVVSSSLLNEKLRSHPDYPSLCSITDTLDELSIDNAALIIDKERLQDAPVPFLAHDTARGEFIVINNIEQQIKSDPDFEKSWNGTAILAEKPVNWKNQENEEWLAKERRTRQTIFAAILSVITIAAFSVLNNFSWQITGLLIATLGGFSIAVLIVQHELGISNDLTEKLCSSGKHTDCDAVMHSEGSRLNKWMNWADAGIVYFTSYSVLLVTLLYTDNAAGMSLLTVISCAAVPFTLFSLYYQWRVVKKWCTLCLLTIGVLLIQFALLFPVTLSLSKGEVSNISFNSISFTAFMFSVVAAGWLLVIKPALQKNNELADKNFSLLRFKNNKEVFEAFLMRQRKVDTTPFENDLQLGNPYAPIQIVVACNPYCGPCAKAHEALHELVEKNDIGLTIRFTVKTENKEDKKLQVVEYILQLLVGETCTYKRKVLHDWYVWMNMEEFKENYPIKENGELEKNNGISGSENGLLSLPVKVELVLHEQWIEESKIIGTPTIFINGYEMPKQYRANDLRIIVRGIEKIIEMIQPIPVENNYAIA